MGFFDFLKSKPEIQETKQLSLGETKVFLNTYFQENSNKASIEIEELREKFLKQKYEILENIQKLTEAEVKNKEIPERVKQVMQGNRDTYQQKIRAFLDHSNLPKELDKISDFYNTFGKSFDDLAKSTAKSHHVMQEFFIKEANAIFAGMKNLDFLINETKKSFEKSKISKITNLKKELSELEQSINERKEINEKIKTQKELEEKTTKEISETETKINVLKQESEYKSFLELEAKKNTLEKESASNAENMLHSFYEIEPALKKYINLNKDDKIAKEYLDNPLQSLLRDKDLNILLLTAEIKKLIIGEEIELKDKKKEKILNEIQKITQENFEAFLSKNINLLHQLDKTNQQISNAEITKIIEQLEKEILTKKEKLEKSKKVIEKIKKNSKVTNENNLKVNLEDNILKSLKEAVKITI